MLARKSLDERGGSEDRDGTEGYKRQEMSIAGDDEVGFPHDRALKESVIARVGADHSDPLSRFNERGVLRIAE